MPISPTSSDILTRYIYSKNQIKVSNQTVRYAAFLPNRNNQTSVFRVTGLSDGDIWNIASIHVTVIRNKPLKARADISAGHVISQNLNLIPQEPPDRHIDIMGWSEDKSKNILKAKELAKQATLHQAP